MKVAWICIAVAFSFEGGKHQLSYVACDASSGHLDDILMVEIWSIVKSQFAAYNQEL
jgi:hypothetical protein